MFGTKTYLIAGKTGTLRKASSSEFPIARFGSGFNQTELGVGQIQIAADLLGRLLLQVKTGQYLPLALGKAAQHTHGDVLILPVDHLAFGVWLMIGESDHGIDGHLIAPRMHGDFDVRRDLAPHYGANVAHQPVRLPQIAALNRLGNDQEYIVDLIVEILRP